MQIPDMIRTECSLYLLFNYNVQLVFEFYNAMIFCVINNTDVADINRSFLLNPVTSLCCRCDIFKMKSLLETWNSRQQHHSYMSEIFFGNLRQRHNIKNQTKITKLQFRLNRRAESHERIVCRRNDKRKHVKMIR